MTAFIGQLTRVRNRSVTRFCKWQRFGPKPQSRQSKAQATRRGALRGAHKKTVLAGVMTERLCPVWGSPKTRRDASETPRTIASRAPRSSRDMSAHCREPRLEEILADPPLK